MAARFRREGHFHVSGQFFPTLFHEGGRLKDEKILSAVFMSNLDSLKTFACACPKHPSGDSLPPVAGNQLQHVFIFIN